ncbi:MAG: hypothetical protein J2P19_34790, partial [Pseudonocardia sp.]|nr:hypothetical protein [Pseudonocardia sp.]
GCCRGGGHGDSGRGGGRSGARSVGADNGSVDSDHPGAGRVGCVDSGPVGIGFASGVGGYIGTAGRGGETGWRALAVFGARRRVVSNGTPTRCHADSKP